MQTLVTKKQLLEDAGYRYSFDRMLYFNQDTKKFFSAEFVDDHSEDELQACINEKSNGTEWRFYFNSQPSVAVKRELGSVLG